MSEQRLDDLDGDGELDDLTAVGIGAGPVAVVTGASRGIGRFLADALEDAGYAVERGSTAVAPVTDPAAVSAWVGDILERQGRVDLLINNAGVIDAEVDVLESDPDQWWSVVSTNLRGPYLLTRALGEALRRSGGRVINVNSGSAFSGAEVASAYCASKAALHQLTSATVAAGIPCLDLMPGVVRTDMTLSMDSHRARAQWTDPAAVVELVLAFASGRLDDWSGRFVRAGADTVASLEQAAAHGLSPRARRLVLRPYGGEDPLG